MNKAIILAAGQGSRMGHLTENIPKALVNFLGEPIINYQINVMRQLGINNIHIVRGYKKEQFKITNVTYHDNLEGFNMIHSLFQAADEFKDKLIISYGDIIYSSHVLNCLVNSIEDIVVIYDVDWLAQFSLRFPKPYNEAETFKITSDNQITELGQPIRDYTDVQGQFIGLIKLSSHGAKIFLSHYQKLKSNSKSFKGKDFRSIYTTEFLQSLIDDGHKVTGCQIKKGWIEFDHINDLNLYEAAFQDGTLNEIINMSDIKNLS
ncbi:MAG: phosphocholine cytidylyltransferase family protein [Bacteroidota bacterium]